MNDSFPDAAKPPSSEEGATPPETLPPVEPPTADFVLQLFILPLVVVAVVVLVYVLFGRLAGGERDALTYVEEIRSRNENRRWRAAFELASLIQNDRSLAEDEALLGTLLEELELALGEEDTDPRLRQFLARTIGAFRITEGRTPAGAEIRALPILARALDAAQPEPVRFAAAESLARLADEHPDLPGRDEAIEALASVLDDPNADRELRQLAIFAIGFFEGDAARERLRAALAPGETDRFVRYNAALALARRGDERALPSLREMLSTDALQKVVRLETEEATARKIEVIQLNALNALGIAAERSHTELLDRLREEVQALTESDLSSVRTEARALLQK